MTKKIVASKSPNFLRFSTLILRAVGGWPHLGDFSTLSEALYHLLSLSAVLVYGIDTGIKIYGIFLAWCYNWTNLEDFLEEIIVTLTTIIVFSKFIIILTSQRRLHDVIKRLNTDLYERYVTTPEDAAVMKKCKKHEMKLTNILITFTYVIAVLVAISPIIKTIRENRKAHLMELEHNITSTFKTGYTPLKYPFVVERFSVDHFVLYFHQILVVLLTANISVAPDTLFTSLFYYLGGLFDILNNRLKREDVIAIDNQKMEEKYKECIHQHQELIKLTEEITKISKPIIILQLLLSSIMICLGVYQIALTTNTSPVHYIKFCMYFMIKFSQLFLYCWHGQELLEKSVQVSNSCYSISWYNSSKPFKTSLRFLIMRSQKPVVLTAGGFFLLSLHTFVNVLKTAYSYLALLKTLSED